MSSEMNLFEEEKKNESLIQGARSNSPEPSCVSMKSDQSMKEPPKFSDRNHSTDLRSVKTERSDWPEPLDGEMPNVAMLKVSKVSPLVTTMGMSASAPLVESASFQHKPPAMREILNIPGAPTQPPLPIQNYRLEPLECAYVLSENAKQHVKSLEVSFSRAHEIEATTQEQSSCQEWHRLRKMRVTSSRFYEVCHVSGDIYAERLAERIYKGTVQTEQMKRGIEMEPVAIREYCSLKKVNYSPCGLVIHPDASWLGCSPDGRIYDPSEKPPFGLLEVTCPDVRSCMDCPYLKMSGDCLKLYRQHRHYWQVQGQILLTGLEWCDFVVCAQEDVHIERIYKDPEVIQTIRNKVDNFFFHYYITMCLQ